MQARRNIWQGKRNSLSINHYYFIYATPLHTTDQTWGMDLKQQLEASIRAMKKEEYKGAAKLFEEVTKEVNHGNH